MARKILEIFKDVLIVVLALAIVVLTLLALPVRTITSTPWLAAILRPVAPLFGLSQSELTYSGDVVADEVHGAAQPIAITVQNTAGRMSAQYDFAALDNAFEQLGGYLAQALDSAQGGRAVSQRELLAAFAEQGAAFCYPSALNPSLAAAWLNVDAPELPDAQWFLLAVEDGGVSLYLAGTESYRCETAVSAAALEAALDSYQPDGSFFAFEDSSGAYKQAAALSLITPQTALVDAIAANPCEVRFVASLASSLGFNPYGDAKYIDPAGTTSFTETTHALSVTAGGRVSFQVSEPLERFQSAADSRESRVEAARELLSTISGGTLGEARLYLTDVSEQDGQTVCTFAYFLNGVYVSAIEPAAVTFEGTRITSASIVLRTLQPTAQPAALLPPAQAAAILRGGQPLALRYVERGEGDLTAAWKG